MSKQGESLETGRESAARRPRGKWRAEQRRRAVRIVGWRVSSVQEVARRHVVRANLLSAWRRQHRAVRAPKPVKFAAVKLNETPFSDDNPRIPCAARIANFT